MGIALFHLLPESAESFNEYYDQTNPESKWKKLPNAFFIAFGAYSLILLIEKVAFDSHSLTEHDHGGHEHPEHHSHKDNELTEHLLEGHKESEAARDHPKEEKGDIRLSKELEPINEVTSFIYDKPVEEEEIQTRPRENSKLSNNSENKLSLNKSYRAVKKTSIDDELKQLKERGYEEESDEENILSEDEAQETVRFERY